MFDFSTASIIIVLLLALVLLGVHVAISLGITSLVGIYLATGKLRIVEATIASTSAEALRDFTFAVIPLFMLMGEFVARCGAARDLFLLLFMISWSCQRLGAATWSASSPKCCALTLEPCRLPRTSRPWPCREARSDA